MVEREPGHKRDNLNIRLYQGVWNWETDAIYMYASSHILVTHFTQKKILVPTFHMNSLLKFALDNFWYG